MPWITLHDGQKLFVRTVGRGKPVVLVHGFASNSSHWLPNVLPLAHRYRFIMPDLRGFGRSCTTEITDEKVFEQYARDLHDVFEHFELDNAMLGGISTGAYICLTYNQRYSFDRVSKYLNIEHTPESRRSADWQHGLFSEKQDELFSVFDKLFALAEEAGRDTPYWSLPDEKDQLMRKLGKKQLTLFLQNPLSELPPSLANHPLELANDGNSLIYTFDTQGDDTGIAALLKELASHDIDFRDLHSKESSLEEIFVNLVRGQA